MILRAETAFWAWPYCNERTCVLAKEDELLGLNVVKQEESQSTEKTLQMPWAGFVEATLFLRSETSLSMEQMKLELGIAGYCWARKPLYLTYYAGRKRSLPVHRHAVRILEWLVGLGSPDSGLVRCCLERNKMKEGKKSSMQFFFQWHSCFCAETKKATREQEAMS